MLPEKVESKIQTQLLNDDLVGLTSYITGKRALNITAEEYRIRYQNIVELYDTGFLELYNDAEYRVFINKVLRVISGIAGTNLLISYLASGEINSIALLIGIPLGANITRFIESKLPKSKLEKLIQEIREDLIQAGGPDLSGMRRIIRAGLEKSGDS